MFLRKANNIIKERKLFSTFIYFIYEIDSDLVKIGVTSNIKKRIGSIKSPNNKVLELKFCIEIQKDYQDGSFSLGNKLEKIIHKHLNKRRISGEWFLIPEHQLRWYLFNKLYDIVETNKYDFISIHDITKGIISIEL